MSGTPLYTGVRLRRMLVRANVRRALVVVVAVVTGLAVAGTIQAAAHARQRWGETREVAVARHDLAPGDVVEPDDVEMRELPQVALADDTLTEVQGGAVVRHPVSEGEPLVAGRLGPDGVTGVPGLVPEGHRAIAVPVGPLGRPPLRVGDQVDVLAVIPSEADLHGHGDAHPTEPAVPLAEHALVVDVTDEAVTIAVPTTETPVVAYAATQSALVLTLTGR